VTNSKRFLLHAGLLGAAFAAWFLACSSDSARPPSTPNFACDDGGPSCGAGNGTSHGTDASKPDADAKGDGDASIPTASVTVSVIQFLDSDFSDKKSTLYTGAAVVSLPGNTTDFPIGGDAGTEFTAQVQLGEAWYDVRPLTNIDFFTTYSRLDLVPDQTSMALPIIDRSLLGSVYVQAGAFALDATAGQIILRFIDSVGVPVSGVQITNSPMKGASSARLYDTGPGGNYAADTGGVAKTSTLGTVIITNVTEGIGAVSYSVEGLAFVTPDIAWVKPQATFAVVTVPD
jgi:hypothetical protein